MPHRKLIWTVHGVLSPSGKGQTDLLTEPLGAAGFDVHAIDYGFRGALWTAFNNGKVAKKISDEMKAEKKRWEDTEIIGLGHSNGCLILKKAADLGAPIDRLVFLAPALDADTKIDKRVKRIFVYYSPTDIATGFSKWLPWSEWGDMGNLGSVLTDERFVNIDRSRLAVPSHSHLDLFQKNKLPFLVSHILKSLEESG